MPSNLTEQQRVLYLATKGSGCPYCRSANLEAGESPEVADNKAVWQMTCHDCGRTWRDVYTLTGVEDVDDDEKMS